VLINTRPKNLSQNINALCAKEKIDLINLHLSEITPISSKEVIEGWRSKLEYLQSYSNIIFTSQASAIYGLEILKTNIDLKKIQSNIFSIGPATTKIIEDKGIECISPNHSSSEFLAKLIIEKYSGKNLLFCGTNSNRTLQKMLKNNIDEVVCYDLVYSDFYVADINKGPKIVLIYNYLTFSFIHDHVDHETLLEKIFIVSSQRIKEKIIKIFGNTKYLDMKIAVAESSSDESMLKKAKEFI
jgi:uroporphyrinogen-III synthase